MHPEIINYLPDLQGDSKRFPERNFFYRVLNALHPETYEALIEQAAKERAPIGKNLQDSAWAMAISPEWMDQLLRYDSNSCKYANLFLPFCSIAKKGRGVSNLLISNASVRVKRRKMNDGTAQEERQENEDINSIHISGSGPQMNNQE